MLLFNFIVSFYFVFFAQAQAAQNETKWYDSYNFHTQRIDNLYVTSLKLSKIAKEDNFKDSKVHEKIKENLQLATKFCSESFESELYFNAQQENRAKSGYEYQFTQISKDLYNKRQEVYKKCRKLKALLSRHSFQYGIQVDGKVANVDYQNHQSVFENVKYIYKEIKGIKDKLKNKQLSSEVKTNVLKYYQNYKNFDCDWEYEKKLYANSKIFFKAQLVANKQKNANRSPASVSSSVEVHSLLDQLERSHISFENMCEEIQHEKDFINSKIKETY